jgi:predicted aspartyl protease
MAPTDESEVIVSALIENYDDVRAAEDGRIPRKQIRRIEVHDARVDTRATYVSIPRKLIEHLGLDLIKTIRLKTIAGPMSFGIYDLVKLTIQGRDCEIRVAEVADNSPVLIGQLPLEMLDFVIDHEARKLVGNPDHDGKWMIDMYHQEFCV